MNIYIGNLPHQIEPSELRKIVNYVMLPSSFRGLLRRLLDNRDRITHSEFNVIDHSSGDQSIRYAHAVIKPDHVARHVLQRLDHLTFQGSSLRAREFVARNTGNDRRSKQYKNLYAVNVYNRRQQERRKSSRV
ncbi:hypothetical protein [Kaarinaea lacus]